MCVQLHSYNLDLDPMTLVLDLDLDVLKMYVRAKNEVSRSGLSKVTSPNRTETDTQRDSCDRTHYQAAVAGDN